LAVLLTIRNKSVKKEVLTLPKTYSDVERAYIKKRLKEEAAYCLSAFGVRRTTVDALIERVKIPKGTFYLFYDSKEILLFEVIMEQHEMIEKQLLDEINTLRDRTTSDSLTEVIYKFFKAAEAAGLLRLITTGEIELLCRKLPQAVMQNHFSFDSAMIKKIFETLSLSENISAAHLAAAFRNLFISMIYQREMGEKYFDEALKLTIRGLVLQMLLPGDV
jgi:AcrR family transcriptional regulator